MRSRRPWLLAVTSQLKTTYSPHINQLFGVTWPRIYFRKHLSQGWIVFAITTNRFYCVTATVIGFPFVAADRKLFTKSNSRLVPQTMGRWFCRWACSALLRGTSHNNQREENVKTNENLWLSVIEQLQWFFETLELLKSRVWWDEGPKNAACPTNELIEWVNDAWNH